MLLLLARASRRGLRGLSLLLVLRPLGADALLLLRLTRAHLLLMLLRPLRRGVPGALHPRGCR